jgi:hypothetical protein
MRGGMVEHHSCPGGPLAGNENLSELVADLTGETSIDLLIRRNVPGDSPPWSHVGAL